MDTTDTSLSDFFSRPLKIFDHVWSQGGDADASFDPWSLFFENPRVSNRLSNYNLLRCKLHIKVLINGNPFLFGRKIMYYTPLPNWNDFSGDYSAKQDTNVTWYSQHPHLYIDPTVSEGGEMVLPFFFYKNYLNIPDGDWAEMGRIYIYDLAPLFHANGATDVANISVFAWAEDVSVSVPTVQNAAGLTAQSGKEVDEANMKGVISGPATNIASVANSLSNVPQLKPLAMATELAATTSATIAKAFGMSRPNITKAPDPYKPSVVGKLATTTVPDNAEKLTLDDKQELSIDPRIAGLGSQDPLAIASIAQRESFIDAFTWNVADSSGTMLRNYRVVPTMYRADGESFGRYATTAVGAASMPFDYWTGSLKFRFQVVKSAYHRGRIKVVYDPYYLTATSEFNTNYLEVVDITDKSDFTVTIGNGQERSLIPTLRFGDYNTTDLYSSTPFSSYLDSNGVIGVYVVNELTTPSSAGPAAIQINVFVSAGDDFEVFVPNEQLSQFVFRNQSGREEGDANGPLQSSSEDSEQYSPPVRPDAEIIGVGDTHTPDLNKVYVGESFRSFRQLLKRYCYHAALQNATDSEWRLLSGWRSMFPYLRGNVAGAVDRTSTAAPYSYCNTLLLHWITLGYNGWRGSVRWKLIPYALSTPDAAYMHISRFTNYDGEQYSSSNVVTPFGITESAARRNATTFGPDIDQTGDVATIGLNGATLASGTVNNAIEFEVPFYSRYRFSPGKTENYTGTANTHLDVWRYVLNAKTTDNTNIDSYVAVGEDFQTYFWTGVPPFFRETVLPAPSAV